MGRTDAERQRRINQKVSLGVFEQNVNGLRAESNSNGKGTEHQRGNVIWIIWVA